VNVETSKGRYSWMALSEKERCQPWVKTRDSASLPLRVIGVHAIGQLEGCGIELENREIAKLVLLGIEELIVVNGRVLTEDPLPVGFK